MPTWRSGSARAASMRAFDALQRCRAIAGAIEHRQWLMVAHWALGAMLLDLLDLPAAVAELERALAQAREIGQLFSVHMAGAFLAETYVAQGDLARAAALLAELHDAEVRMDTLGLRLAAYAQAKLALAQNKLSDALAIAGRRSSSLSYGCCAARRCMRLAACPRPSVRCYRPLAQREHKG